MLTMTIIVIFLFLLRPSKPDESGGEVISEFLHQVLMQHEMYTHEEEYLLSSLNFPHGENSVLLIYSQQKRLKRKISHMCHPPCVPTWKSHTKTNAGKNRARDQRRK